MSVGFLVKLLLVCHHSPSGSFTVYTSNVKVPLLMPVSVARCFVQCESCVDVFLFLFLHYKGAAAGSMFLTPACQQLSCHQQAVSTATFVKGQAGWNRDACTPMLILPAPASTACRIRNPGWPDLVFSCGLLPCQCGCKVADTFQHSSRLLTCS